MRDPTSLLALRPRIGSACLGPERGNGRAFGLDVRCRCAAGCSVPVVVFKTGARQFGPLLSRASWGSSFVGQLQRLEKGITRI